MGKLGWVVIIVLVLLLFRDRIGEEVNSLTRPTTPPPGGYYGAPPPGYGYYSSPPTTPATSVTDIINHVIDAGVTLYQGYNAQNRPTAMASPSSPQPTRVDYTV